MGFSNILYEVKYFEFIYKSPYILKEKETRMIRKRCEGA